jgi:26S proteasome regulatory subunit N10
MDGSSGIVYRVALINMYVQMALRHRKNKNGGQRIVLFVGSPTVDGTEAEYQSLGALARKNGVAVDIVAMGENDENASRLSALVTAANKEGNSHFLSVPAGVLPSDMLSSHPIMHGDNAGGGAGPAAGMLYCCPFS